MNVLGVTSLDRSAASAVQAVNDGLLEGARMLVEGSVAPSMILTETIGQLAFDVVSAGSTNMIPTWLSVSEFG